jgi:hypothetical protein
VGGHDGRTIGKVHDLIVDTERMAVRYLEVELDASAFHDRDDPRVLIPVERAHRDADLRRLIVEGLSMNRVTELCDARERHMSDFWARWWDGDPGPAARSGRDEWAPRISRRVSTDELRDALDETRDGEPVHIPVVDEELVVDPRPATRD